MRELPVQSNNQNSLGNGDLEVPHTLTYLTPRSPKSGTASRAKNLLDPQKRKIDEEEREYVYLDSHNLCISTPNSMKIVSTIFVIRDRRPDEMPRRSPIQRPK